MTTVHDASPATPDTPTLDIGARAIATTDLAWLARQYWSLASRPDSPPERRAFARDAALTLDAIVAQRERAGVRR